MYAYYYKQRLQDNEPENFLAGLKSFHQSLTHNSMIEFTAYNISGTILPVKDFI